MLTTTAPRVVRVDHLSDAQLAAIVLDPRSPREEVSAAALEGRLRDEARRRRKLEARRRDLRQQARRAERVADAVRPPHIGTLAGLAIPFEAWGRPSEFKMELIGPNAVDAVLADGGEVAFLVDHFKGLPLARRSNGSLRLAKVATGLRVEADLPATDEGEQVAAILEGGQATGFSFNIKPASEIRKETLGIEASYIRRLAFTEISLITAPNRPAYPLQGTITWRRV